MEFENSSENIIPFIKDYVTPQTFGAVGDGITDDTNALKAALASGKNVLLPEGIYIINEPLFVNVHTTSLLGTSTRSALKIGDKFPIGETVLTFYSPDGNFENRQQRENVHGSFSVLGRNYECNGIRLGGERGTEYEGHMECSVFKNILVDRCNIAYIWGAHVYRNTLFHCDSHSNRICLKTSDDIRDSGEAFTCFNCGFWSGAMHLKNCGEIMLYSCTIHTRACHTVDGKEYGHYFENCYVSFQNCHFEAITQWRKEDALHPLPTQFYSLNALVYLNNCLAGVTGEFLTLKGPLFVAEATNGAPYGIFVEGGLWKYYFCRLHIDKLTSGNVILRNIPLKRANDGAKLNFPIYDYTKPLSLNRDGDFDYYHNISKEERNNVSISATSTDKGKTLFTIKISKDLRQNAIGFYRKVDISGFRSVKISGSFEHGNQNCKCALATDDKETSILMFADMYDNLISFGSPLNFDTYATRNPLCLNGEFVTIPAGAKYAYIGFDIRREGGLSADTYTILSDMTYEFL